MSAKRKRQKYSGYPFPKTAYARMDPGDEETPAFPEFWVDGGPGGMLDMDVPRWIATYRLVSVRKLKRTVRVVRAR